MYSIVYLCILPAPYLSPSHRLTLLVLVICLGTVSSTIRQFVLLGSLLQNVQGTCLQADLGHRLLVTLGEQRLWGSLLHSRVTGLVMGPSRASHLS